VELARQLRLRQRVTKGAGSRAAGVAMAFKLIESAQTRWRAVNAPHLVALVRAGAVFRNGKLIERPDGSGARPLASRLAGFFSSRGLGVEAGRRSGTSRQWLKCKTPAFVWRAKVRSWTPRPPTPSCVRHLRPTRRVRTRVDHRAHTGWPDLGTCPRP
jgi:hypothetical protein